RVLAGTRPAEKRSYHDDRIEPFHSGSPPHSQTAATRRFTPRNALPPLRSAKQDRSRPNRRDQDSSKVIRARDRVGSLDSRDREGIVPDSASRAPPWGARIAGRTFFFNVRRSNSGEHERCDTQPPCFRQAWKNPDSV